MLLLSVIGLIENKGMGLTREVPELAVVLGCIALHLLSEAWRDHSTSSGLNASADRACSQSSSVHSGESGSRLDLPLYLHIFFICRNVYLSFVREHIWSLSFQPPIPTSGQLRRAKATIQVSCTSALNYDALWRFCAMDFSASGQKRRLCRRSTRTLMANLPFQSHHRYAISLSFPTTQVCYRVQSKDVRFHFWFISCWSARSQCVRLARPTRCSSSPARPVY